ncbi:MAG: hypothetical protein IT245_06675, partial [Bacteroidia bacterium]|nr:hypothetical protein [Bacteroidia bacterium]
MSKAVSILKGIFQIGKEGSTDLTEILDAQAECNGGFHSCYQGLISKDLETGVRHIGYFYGGVWTTKTLAAFKSEGPAPVG